MTADVDRAFVSLVGRYGRAAVCPVAVQAEALEPHLEGDEWTRLVRSLEARARIALDAGPQISTPLGRTLLLSAIFDGAGLAPVSLEPGMPWPRDGRFAQTELDLRMNACTLHDLDTRFLKQLCIRW